jgi:hypothetical protein
MKNYGPVEINWWAYEDLVESLSFVKEDSERETAARLIISSFDKRTPLDVTICGWRIIRRSDNIIYISRVSLKKRVEKVYFELSRTGVDTLEFERSPECTIL